MAKTKVETKKFDGKIYEVSDTYHKCTQAIDTNCFNPGIVKRPVFKITRTLIVKSPNGIMAVAYFDKDNKLVASDPFVTEEHLQKVGEVSIEYHKYRV